MSRPVRIESWWRCVTDSAGNVVEATIVEAAGTDGGGVFFVRACDEESARKDAFRKHMRERYRRLKAEGLCRCGKVNDSGTGSRCKACKARDSRYAKRARAKARGEEVAVLDRGDALRARRESDRVELRLEALREAHRKLLALGRDAGMRWLREEIERLDQASRGRKVA